VAGGGSACEKCAANDGQIVELGASFNSGNSQPPAHPHCRCNLRPVVPDYEDISVDEQGVARINPPAVNEAGVNDIRLITPEMKEGVQSYAAGGYTRINGTLRGLTEAEMRTVRWSDYLRAEIKLEIQYIDEAILTAPKLKTELITYRGVKGELAETLGNLVAGDEYVDLGFMSTSKTLNTAQAFSHGKGGKILKIINPKGTMGLDMDDFIEDAIYESEWLLPRGSRLKIVSVADDVITAEVVLVAKVNQSAVRLTSAVDNAKNSYTKLKPVKGAKDLSDTANFQISDNFRQNKVPFAQEQGLYGYTSNSYREIQLSLRDPSAFLAVTDTDRVALIKKTVSGLDDMIKSAPSLPSDLLTFRGVNGDIADTIRGLKVGQSFIDSGFASSSLSKDVAQVFADVVWSETKNTVVKVKGGIVVEIVNPSGTAGVMADGFKGIASERNIAQRLDMAPSSQVQLEWVLPRGSRFEVISTDGTNVKVVIK